MGGEGPEVDEVGGAAEDDEGAELDEDPSVREDGGFLDEVDELQGDGEVGDGDEEVGDVLVLHQELVRWPLGLDAVADFHHLLVFGGSSLMGRMDRIDLGF